MSEPYSSGMTATLPDVALPPRGPGRGSGPRLAMLIVGALILMALLAASLSAFAGQARSIAYPRPRVNAHFTAQAGTPLRVGEAMTFTAVAAAGRHLTLTWDFGDNTTAVGTTVRHAYRTFGNPTVTLTAQDPIGQRATSVLHLTILPQPPQASFLDQVSPDDPLTFTFDASMSTGDNLSYQWTYGDGYTDSGQQVLHSYSSLGTYTVTLVVTDAANQTNTTSMQVNVTAPQPSASFTTTNDPSGGDGVDFDASASTGTNLTYNWDFGDGNSESDDTATTSHFYSGPGTYTVNLTVTDSFGQTSTVSHAITAP